MLIAINLDSFAKIVLLRVTILQVLKLDKESPIKQMSQNIILIHFFIEESDPKLHPYTEISPKEIKLYSKSLELSRAIILG